MFLESILYVYEYISIFFIRMNNILLIVELRVGRWGKSLTLHLIPSIVHPFHSQNTCSKGEYLGFR